MKDTWIKMVCQSARGFGLNGNKMYTNQQVKSTPWDYGEGLTT